MTDKEIEIQQMVNAEVRDLMVRTRAILADYGKQIRVGLTIQVGGQTFEYSIKSPALDGDDMLQRERPELTT